MHLHDVLDRVAARVHAHDGEDVAVRTELGRDGVLHVTVSSRNPLTYCTQGIALRADGTVGLDAPDDGFTTPGAEPTTVGPTATADDAVELVVREVDDAVNWLRTLQARAAVPAQPAEQSAISDAALAIACEMWQGGRDSAPPARAVRLGR